MQSKWRRLWQLLPKHRGSERRRRQSCREETVVRGAASFHCAKGPWQESQEGWEQGQEKLVAEGEGCPGSEWDENILTTSRGRTKLTKRQKRINKQQYRRDTEQQALAHPLDLTADEVRDMQEKDDLLVAAVGGVSMARMGFFE